MVGRKICLLILSLYFSSLSYGAESVLEGEASPQKILESHIKEMDTDTKEIIGKRSDYARYVLNDVRSLISLPKNSQVLDVGSGTGVIAQHLKEMGYLVTVVDFDLDALSWGYEQKHFEGADILIGKLQDLPDSYNNFFDAVTFGSVLIPFKEWESFYEKLRKVMKPGAKAYFFFATTDFSAMNYKNALKPVVEKYFNVIVVDRKEDFGEYTLVILTPSPK